MIDSLKRVSGLLNWWKGDEGFIKFARNREQDQKKLCYDDGDFPGTKSTLFCYKVCLFIIKYSRNEYSLVPLLLVRCLNLNRFKIKL